MITFTILAFSQVFTRRETVLSCLLFAAVHLLLHGIMFWNIAYLIIFPAYGLLFSSCRGFLSRHPGCIPFYGAFFSFLTGQLVDLPFLLLSDTVTVLYMIMGLKTSLIQGCLTFLTLLFLFEPIEKVLFRSKTDDEMTRKENDDEEKLILAAAAVAVIAAVAIGAMLLRPSGTQGAKEVTVTVIDQTQDPEKEVLNETFRTDAKTLSEFLEETEGLDAELSQSDYGSLLESIAGLKQDMDNGPWLTYSSENNASCQAAGYCPAADDVMIEDGDAFVFTLIAEF